MPAGFRRSRIVTGCLLVGLLAACGGSAGGTPNSAGSATVVPGAAPKLGEGNGGGISITGTSIVRTGTKLAVTATIHSEASSADKLTSLASNVGPTLALTPPLDIAPGATVMIGGGETQVVLTDSGRLEPGGTVALSFQFNDAGAVQVFSKFRDAS